MVIIRTGNGNILLAVSRHINGGRNIRIIHYINISLIISDFIKRIFNGFKRTAVGSFCVGRILTVLVRYIVGGISDGKCNPPVNRLIWMKLELPRIGHSRISAAYHIIGTLIKYIASPGIVMTNPPGIRRRHPKATVICDTVKGGFDMLVDHVKTPVIFIYRCIVIFPGASNHDIGSGSHFYGPAS